MGFDELSSEMQEKLKACENIEDLETLCAEAGIKLSDEEIEGLAGGSSSGKCTNRGPHCSTACSMHYVSPCPKAKR